MFSRNSISACALSLVLLSGVCQNVAAQSANQNEIDQTQLILDGIGQSTTRLLIGVPELSRIQADIAASPLVQAQYTRHIAEANRLLNESTSTYTLIGPRLLQVSKQVRDRVMVLSLAYRLTGDTRYRARAFGEMDAACNFPDWNSSHFLDTAEMTAGIAFGYDWLRNDLTPDQRIRYANAIRDKGLLPGRSAYRTPITGPHNNSNFWVVVSSNHNPVCNSGMILGAMAIYEREPLLGAEIVASAKKSLGKFISDYPEDGGYVEGANYWAYSMEYLGLAFASMEATFGHTMGLSIDAWQDNATKWMVDQNIGNRQTNFGDTGHFWASQGISWMASKTQNRALATRLAGQRQNSNVWAMDLLWMRPDLVDSSQTPLRSTTYASIAHAYLRRGTINLPTKAGNNAASHAHRDLGTFILDALGERWVQDLGPEDYNISGPLEASGRTVYRKSSVGHNTLTFTGRNQDANGVGTIFKSSMSETNPFVVYDLKNANRTTTKSWRRGFKALPNDRMVLQDEWIPTRGTSATWAIHTAAMVTLQGKQATLTQNGKTIRMRILEPRTATFTYGNAQPALPESPNPGITKVQISLRASTTSAQRIVVLIGPDVSSAIPVTKGLTGW